MHYDKDKQHCLASNHDKIVALKNAGFTDRAVAKEVGTCRKAIYNVMKRHHENGTTSERPIPGRKRSVLTSNITEVVKKRMARNPRRSLRKMAKEMHISQTSLRRLVKERLRMKAYKMSKRHMISESSKKKRLDRATKMLKEMKSAGQKAFIWSDEKIFTV